MKTTIFIFCCAVVLFTGCKKSDNPDNSQQSQNPYLNIAAESSWNYHENDSSGAIPQSSDYTVTSTSSDTMINSKSYHVYNYSYGGHKYLNISGHSYYQFDSIPGSLGQVFERLYLKDDASVGASWKQDLSVTVSGLPIPVTITNNLIEKGISRTVNGKSYTNVIHVSTSITSSAIPPANLTSAINSYYAPNYGSIENTTKVHLDLDFLGITENVNIETKLVSAVLK